MTFQLLTHFSTYYFINGHGGRGPVTIKWTLYKQRRNLTVYQHSDALNPTWSIDKASALLSTSFIINNVRDSTVKTSAVSSCHHAGRAYR